MGARPAKTFPAPGAYAISSPTNVVTQTQPEQILPPQQFLDPGSYSGAGAVAVPATHTLPIRRQGGGGKKRFFGDDGLDDIGYKPMIKLPTKKPGISPPPFGNPIDPYTGK